LRKPGLRLRQVKSQRAGNLTGAKRGMLFAVGHKIFRRKARACQFHYRPAA